MIRLWLPWSLIFVIVLALACGGADPTAAPTATPAPQAPADTPSAAQPTAPPAAQPTARPTTPPTATMAAAAPASGTAGGDSGLETAAARLAGGPGAIYAGDLKDLVGPVPEPISGDIGDYDGVPYEGLEDYLYVFESDYYQTLLERANYDSPTQATTAGLELNYQLACINRSLTHCKLAEWFSDRVFERTGGQLKIDIIGYPELGIAGPDVLELLANGTLSIAELPSAYTAGDLPAMDMKYLWGIFASNEDHFKATANAIPALDGLIEERTGGGVTIFQMWRVPENELFFFSKNPIVELADFEGLKVRSFGGALSDMIDGMGSEAQWVAFAEVYTALERGILDGGVTGANAAYGQRWYEVADYMAGPIPLFTVENATFNPDVWAELPEDFRQILLEEGARYELEFFRVTPVLSSLGIPKLLDEGMIYNEFNEEIRRHLADEVALNYVVPQWVSRVGGTDTPEGREVVRLFNEYVGPIAGIVINDDGSASPIGN